MHTGLPVSVQDKEEKATGAGAPPIGGVAGTGSNLNAPTYPSGNTSSGSPGSMESTLTTTNYDNNTTHTVTHKAPGSIQNVSVAALVDTSVPVGDIDKIKQVIAAAIGAAPGEASRYVTVQQMTFDTSAIKAQDAQAKAIMSQQMWGNIAKAAAVCVVAVILLAIILRTSRSSEPELAMIGAGSNIGLLNDATTEEVEAMLEQRPLRVEDVLAEMPEAYPSQHRPKRRMHAPTIEEHQNLKMESIAGMIDFEHRSSCPTHEGVDG